MFLVMGFCLYLLPCSGQCEPHNMTALNNKFLHYQFSHDTDKIAQVLDKLKQKATDEDIQILKEVCAAVSKRAARLAAAGLAAIVQVILQTLITTHNALLLSVPKRNYSRCWSSLIKFVSIVTIFDNNSYRLQEPLVGASNWS